MIVYQEYVNYQRMQCYLHFVLLKWDIMQYPQNGYKNSKQTVLQCCKQSLKEKKWRFFFYLTLNWVKVNIGCNCFQILFGWTVAIEGRVRSVWNLFTIIPEDVRDSWLPLILFVCDLKRKILNKILQGHPWKWISQTLEKERLLKRKMKLNGKHD